MRDYIPVNKEELPEQFELDLADETFVFEFNYNQAGDFFTVDLYNIQRQPIILGEKLVLNEPLWQDSIDSRLPAPTLVVMDEADKETCMTFDNFMVTTFLYIDDVASTESEPNLGEEL
ncbi:phage baseplate plug protein [Priestia aryabhattai]|uniref:phage baseplate plug family protein n=1 Tax=Priestia megaterium TaxID=1404 RepID=UPI0039B899D5